MKDKVIGMTNWFNGPRLVFADKDGAQYHHNSFHDEDLDKKLYPEYWEKDKSFPHDPKTGRKLTDVYEEQENELFEEMKSIVKVLI